MSTLVIKKVKIVPQHTAPCVYDYTNASKILSVEVDEGVVLIRYLDKRGDLVNEGFPIDTLLTFSTVAEEQDEVE